MILQNEHNYSGVLAMHWQFVCVIVNCSFNTVSDFYIYKQGHCGKTVRRIMFHIFHSGNSGCIFDPVKRV